MFYLVQTKARRRSLPTTLANGIVSNLGLVVMSKSGLKKTITQLSLFSGRDRQRQEGLIYTTNLHDQVDTDLIPPIDTSPVMGS